MSVVAQQSPRYVLGLDLGSASLGWALIEIDENETPISLLKAGVRIFEPGVDGTDMEIQEGKDQSKAVNRRTARLHRRQLRRRAARQKELFLLLQTHGLLPPPEHGPEASAAQRHELLESLDREIYATFGCGPDGQSFAQKPLYFLRARALDHRLEAFELGRVLFHLSQRRGFLSNRKDVKKSEKEKEDIEGVKAQIRSLKAAIEQAGARTLGEYFAQLDPHEARIRNRWTARRMFEDEFAQIWAAQQPHHAATMTPELREQVAHLLFFQRPIAQQKHLIGRCELEPGKRRAPWASMAAQRFRMLQKINDLKYENIQTGESVLLSPEQRQRLYEHLDREGSLKFTALRKFLDLKGTVFNLERGGDKEMPGNRTRKSMLKVFGEHWNTLLPGKQNHIIDQWRNSEADELLQQEAQQHFGLDAEAAAMLAKEKPAADYCSLSLTAIAKLMPYMLDGKSYKAAEKLAYPEFSRLSGMKALDRVPPVREALPALRNPAVERALTEVRKVVNAIVRSHAKPYAIRIELARELKKSRDKRQRAVNNTRRREAERKAAIERILKEIGDPSPRRDLIEKALLFEECGGICPYTGKSMSFTSLVNDGIVQVEHIIPITRFPDNSFQNKTLCDGSFNRMKGNRTPYEVFEGSPEEYEEMLNRVRAWPIKNFSKLNRFRVGEPGIREDNTLEGFSARQLNDTCYTSRSAKKLLATLYGGEVVTAEDGCPQQVVYATSGTVTAVLRRSWGLEAILRELVPPQPGEQRGKPRIDHRHHAIDAITIGATKQRMIQAMARDSARNIDPRTRPDIPAPWKDFVDSIRPHIEQMLVSHRPEHKLSGEFHDETNYGKPYKEGAKTIVHIRKKVTSLTAKDIESIVDAEVRKAVEAKADALDGGLAACEIKNDWPALQARDGRLIPIRKVRMKKVLEVTRIGRGDDTFANTQRYVAESSNHHVAVFARLDVHGKEMRWEGMVVSLLEAYQKASAIRRSEAYRKHHRATSIVQKSIPGEPNQAFKFSLMGGDTIETFSDYAERGKSYKAGIYRVRTIAANGQISLVRISDARMKKDIKAAKEWWSPTVDGLRKLGCSKVVIDLQGNKRYAND